MTRTIAQRELRNDNARVIDAVTEGETFIVTRNGHPVAELRPVSQGRRRLVPRIDVVTGGGRIRIDREQFRRDLDQSVSQEW